MFAFFPGKVKLPRFHHRHMVSKVSMKKEALVKMLVQCKDDILKNEHAKQGLIDAILPLSAYNAEIVNFSEDGVVVIKFKENVDGYIDNLTKKKIIAVLDAVENPI